jgi:polyisoprenyl-teichoic acid--peptidoglycan teichoic acid transferase
MGNSRHVRALAAPRPLGFLPLLLLVSLIAGACAPAGPAGASAVGQAAASAAASATPSPSPSPTPTPSPSPSSSPAPSPTPPATGVLGADGRLTVLLLGSDYRPAHPGNRTDVIMVVSIDPNTGTVAAASIPRDTTAFPTSSKGVYKAKINGLYQSLIAKNGQAKAARQMKQIIGKGIGVEIDSYAVIGFAGVQKLIDAVGGVDVTLKKSVSDPSYWVTAKKRGIHFPAGKNHLNGSKALIFARTRHGDNDFERARRQQLLVGAAVAAVRERGLTKLPALVSIATKYVKTDLPLTAAPELFAIVAKADVAHPNGVVFGPRQWASSAGGTSFSLKLKAVRAWTKKWMAPVAAPPAGG